MYIVQECIGDYDDIIERIIFVTSNKKLAEKWKEKYERIIENNKERISNYYDDENYDKPYPLWHDKIVYRLPRITITEIERR